MNLTEHSEPEGAPELPWTGERFIPGHGGEALGLEHEHRYEFVRRYSSGRRVLDLGCGHGYGSAILSAAGATAVVAADVAIEAVNRTVRGAPAVRGLVTSAMQLPIRSESFDLVVCMEVIEHVADPSSLVREARRVLGGDGIFVVSTPNKSVYNSPGLSPNPFHISEMELAEFRTLLEDEFGFVDLFAQRVVSASLLWPVDRRVPPSGELLSEPSAPPYVVAICSKRPVEVPGWSSYTRWTNEAADREEGARAYISELEATIAALAEANSAAAAREAAAGVQLKTDFEQIIELRSALDRLSNPAGLNAETSAAEAR